LNVGVVGNSGIGASGCPKELKFDGDWRLKMKKMICIASTVAFCVTFVAAGSEKAAAQYGSRTAGGGFSSGGTSFRPGNYQPVLGNAVQHNPTTNSTYVPGVGVSKPSGFYSPIGNGYYQNGATSHVYSPSTGSYTTNRNIELRGGTYNPVPGTAIQHNSTTNTTYLPGVGVSKSCGFYSPIGNGYYQNPNTNNVYNPSTGAYIRSR
jgi:hypothetical protein